MISFSAVSSVASAGHYFYEHSGTSQGEYYANERSPSAWGGEGAAIALLPLGGEVDRQNFERVLQGKLWNTRDQVEQQLGRATKEGIEHRPGMDLTFSAPKSVSILSEVGGDERVRAAHESAVERAMGFLEKHAAFARVTTDGQTEMRSTGNLLYAKFSHDTSRENDPNTHTHVVVANATFDMKDGVWRSLSNEQILKLRTTADAVYRSELANGLQRLGYELDFGRQGKFEVAGVSREHIEHFSQRSQDMDAWLRERGLSKESASGAIRQEACLATRSGKVELPRDQLRGEWALRASSIGLDVGHLANSAQARGNLLAMPGALSRGEARQAVLSAVEHLSEREAAWSSRDLIKASAELSRGRARFTEIEGSIQRLKNTGDLIERADGKYTSPAAVALERQQESLIRSGKGTSRQIAPHESIQAGLDRFAASKSFALNQEQVRAVRLIAESRDRFVAVQGYAGTGKTTMLEAVKEIAQSQGYVVVGMSSGAKQAAILEQDSGIQSQTVASFLAGQRRISRDAQPKASKPEVAVKETSRGRYLMTNRGTFVARTGIFHPLNTLALRAQAKFAEAKYRAEGEGRVLGRFGAAIGEHFAKSMVKWEKAGLLEAGFVRANHAATHAMDSHRASMAAKGRSTLGIQKKELWVVDESSMLSQKDMTSLMKYADQRGAKVVFVGDTAQHQSVEAGRASDLAMKQGIARAELRQVSRQKDEAGRDAVSSMLSGRNEDAFERLAKVEVREPSDLVKRLAADFVSSQDRDRTVVVTSSNSDRHAINAEIRQGLRANGVLKGEGVRVASLLRKDLTRVEQSLSGSYEPGDVLRAGRQYSRDGVQRGDYLRVVGVDSKSNTLRCINERTGATLSIRPDRSTNYLTYVRREVEFANGDRVRFGLNDQSLGVRNGEIGTVVSVKPGEISVRGRSGELLKLDPSRYQHVEHGYASTSYGAQGETQSKAMLHINTKAGAFGDRNFYVGITRARQGTTIYTDDVARAAVQVSQRQSKQAATDIGQGKGNFSNQSSGMSLGR